mmetsp:Transcript_39732/g.84810  ORF Transcript_39732/g.84810 Transcript_39732/m.84810 type:complete len:209 (+) Transcript_39732:932-1558(+)
MEAGDPHVKLVVLQPQLLLQLCIRLTHLLQRSFCLLLTACELSLQIGDGLVHGLWVLVADVLQGLALLFEDTQRLGGPSLLHPQRVLELVEDTVEEFHIRPPYLLQRDPTLSTMVCHLTHDLVQCRRKDWHKVLQGPCQLLLGSAHAQLRVALQGPRDPGIQQDGISAARGYGRGEDPGVPESVSIIVDAARILRQKARLVDVVALRH